MKDEMSAAEFRALLKSGDIQSGKKGRLKLTNCPGHAIEQLGNPELQPAPKTIIQGKIKGSTVASEQSARARFDITMVLKFLRLEYVEEFKFDQTKRRRFSFDFAIHELQVGVEYEGIGFQKDGSQRKSRHTSVKGYTMDCTKYNLAQKQGWIALRYTAKNLHELVDDLAEVMELRRKPYSFAQTTNDECLPIPTPNTNGRDQYDQTQS